MKMVCLDLEGVLVPEIWINFAEITGIKELRLTTRDISDYTVLMNKRIGILKENKLRLNDIHNVINQMDPLPGASEFLKELRAKTQLVILSDTFTQFAGPLMKKLDWPTLFCNDLIVDQAGTITGFQLRQNDGKKKAVMAFKSCGMEPFAAGDSYNDTSMIKEAHKGAFFCPPESIISEFPDIPVTKNYKELMTEIDTFLA